MALGGNVSSLEDIDNTFFNERQIIGPNRQGYTTNSGITSMATEVQNSTPGGGSRIGIGHSMGGTAVRQATLWNNNHWLGVVTMGSPLRGAQVAASGQNGTNSAFVGNGETRMIAGPNVGSAVSPPLLAGLGIEFLSLGPIAQVYSKTLADWSNKKLMDKFDLEGQTVTDLSPGSSYQNTIVGQSASVPKILIWGSESYPILWKIVGTYAIRDSETNGINLAEDITNIYNLAVDGEEFQSWVNFPFHGFHQWRKGKWEEGRNWMNTDSNDGWRHVIGATWTEFIPTTYWENTCSEEHYYNFCDTQPDPEVCRSYCIITYPWGYNVYHDLPSDGVVTAESAINSGGSWQGQPLEAYGINHGEFKDPDRIKGTLNWVFDGNHNSSVFQIGRR